MDENPYKSPDEHLPSHQQPQWTARWWLWMLFAVLWLVTSLTIGRSQ